MIQIVKSNIIQILIHDYYYHHQRRNPSYDLLVLALELKWDVAMAGEVHVRNSLPLV